MTSPENVIIKEQGPFYNQPAWVEDYYQNVLKVSGYNKHTLAFGTVTDYLRHRHNFPPEAEGLVLQFSDAQEPENGQITGHVLNPEEHERFLEFVRNGYRLEEKNNWVLIDDLVKAIVDNDIFDNENKSLDEIYPIIREAVYRSRPHSGPDDVWINTIVDTLFEHGHVKEGLQWADLRLFFTKTFTDLVYGHHPRPEPTVNSPSNSPAHN